MLRLCKKLHKKCWFCLKSKFKLQSGWIFAYLFLPLKDKEWQMRGFGTLSFLMLYVTFLCVFKPCKSYMSSTPYAFSRFTCLCTCVPLYFTLSHEFRVPTSFMFYVFWNIFIYYIFEYWTKDSSKSYNKHQNVIKFRHWFTYRVYVLVNFFKFLKLKITVTLVTLMFHLYTRWTREKISMFFTFSGGIKMDGWREMG